MLGIRSQGREETRALVQAMESCVERVWLDIEALTENSGQGDANIRMIVLLLFVSHNMACAQTIQHTEQHNKRSK